MVHKIGNNNITRDCLEASSISQHNEKNSMQLQYPSNETKACNATKKGKITKNYQRNCHFSRQRQPLIIERHNGSLHVFTKKKETIGSGLSRKPCYNGKNSEYGFATSSEPTLEERELEEIERISESTKFSNDVTVDCSNIFGLDIDENNTTATSDESEGKECSEAKNSFSKVSLASVIPTVFWEQFEDSLFPRAVADVTSDQLETSNKKRIWIIYKVSCSEKSTPVSWFEETSLEDLREAILCACDSIVDTGFSLHEALLLTAIPNKNEFKEVNWQAIKEVIVDGCTYYSVKIKELHFEDFHMLKKGGIYFLEENEGLEVPKGAIGDRWRRIKILVEPLMHGEVKIALNMMRAGTNLIKYTTRGLPHIRQFQLSKDNRRLVWYTASKNKELSRVYMKDINEIRIGQTTEAFKRYKMPILQYLSFSIIYGAKNRTLDLACTDENEFDYWLVGIKALAFSEKKQLISKERLLCHSRRFRKALEANKPSIKFTSLQEIDNSVHKGFEAYIELPILPTKDLEEMFEKLEKRLSFSLIKIRHLNHKFTIESDNESNQQISNHNDVRKLKSKSNLDKYKVCAGDNRTADDDEMEMTRIVELADDVAVCIEQARKALLDINIQLGLEKQLQNKKDPVVVSISSNGAVKFKQESASNNDTLSHITALGRNGAILTEIQSQLIANFNQLLGVTWNEDDSASSYQKCGQRQYSAQEERTLQTIYQLLWKAEVDLENIDDMCSRQLQSSYKLCAQHITQTLTDANMRIAKFGNDVSEVLTNFFQVDNYPTPGLFTR
ncbi:hypothetical protein IE077_004192 [Cardiosporidium cionae]|uniref:PH domain-containing protein n=1 Tax=Cardiosporidium cionae TaxID=476202 RepID=A0ABQ7J673_9APIC|nr:hypothetical protein IE077_004192 [Cardiosporidium cionae]|eukprot:KAF8819478.1 hypothetical protein IE077_004192 [Cardiosporidium cionae]